MRDSREEPQPPRAPDIERHLKLSTAQWIGVPLLLLLPVLALAGVFNEKRAETAAEGPELEVRVDFPARLRHRQHTHVEARVHNRSAETLERVTVSFDTSFLAAFSHFNWMPKPLSDSHEVELGRIGPGEQRSVRLELEGARYGRHRGAVRARAGGTETQVEIDTFLFP